MLNLKIKYYSYYVKNFYGILRKFNKSQNLAMAKFSADSASGVFR
ncbi:hypothetical protein ACWIUD_02980 [Helicobacter sp. 23-1044]